MVLYLSAVGTVWVRLGRSIGQVSNHLVELEEQINDLSGVPDPLLTWETRAAQRRNFYRRVFIGKPLDPASFARANKSRLQGASRILTA